MLYIYILKLRHGKYYIGKTINPNVRICNHFSRNGSVWTRRYKPVKIEKLIETDDAFDEDKWTLKYMDMKGIQNVRGGSFCQMTLSPDMKALIARMLNGSKDRCFKCGNTGHFVKNCNQSQPIGDEVSVVSDSESSNDLMNEGELVFPELDSEDTVCPCSCIIL